MKAARLNEYYKTFPQLRDSAFYYLSIKKLIHIIRDIQNTYKLITKLLNNALKKKVLLTLNNKMVYVNGKVEEELK